MSDIKSWEMVLDGVLARFGFGFGFESRLGREPVEPVCAGALGAGRAEERLATG